jgi:hypothetical protein
MQQHEQEAALRLEDALKALVDLDERIAAMAMEYGLGDVDAPPESGRVIFPEIGGGEETDESIAKVALDSLRLAHLAVAAAIVEIDETGDASGAVAHVITAARIYGLTRCLMLTWRTGVRQQAEMLAALGNELRNEKLTKERSLAKGRPMGAEKQAKKSREARARAQELAQEAFTSRAHEKHNGVLLSTRLDTRAAWVKLVLDREGFRKVNGGLYSLRTVKNMIGEIKQTGLSRGESA